MKIPTTCAEMFEAANLPFQEGNNLLSQANSEMVVQCFSQIYPNFGFGYLHSSDHYYALQILLEREPTFREVYDSYHGGSRNIDAAREKVGGGKRPDGWEGWTEEQRRLAVLVHLYGSATGSRIFDGKRADPSPQKTRELMLLWGMNTRPIDPPPPPPPPPPTKAAKITVQGEIVVTEADGTVRRIPFAGGDA